METSEARRETSRCKIIRPRACKQGDKQRNKCKTSGQLYPEQAEKVGQVETSATRREASRETTGDRQKNKHPAKCIQSRQRKHQPRRTQSGLGDKGDKWETSVK